jgi:2-polyprenyl-3-methyl-5-hydroxy-6-metoxy-1,4-benzoquinol methylase
VKRNFEIDPTLPSEQYDLAICLEVLEHLKKETAESLVSEIAKKASLLVFSAAMKGQGGTGHVNENTLEYWIELLRKNNFIPFDVIRPKMSSHKAVPDYYKQNMILFWHPENCHRNKTIFNLEALLSKNALPVSDMRGIGKKVRYFLASFIPPRIVTFIVIILDKTIRR